MPSGFKTIYFASLRNCTQLTQTILLQDLLHSAPLYVCESDPIGDTRRAEGRVTEFPVDPHAVQGFRLQKFVVLNFFYELHPLEHSRLPVPLPADNSAENETELVRENE